MASDRDKSSDDKSGGHESKRGFASMDEDKQREIASKGGHASHGGHGSQEATNRMIKIAIVVEAAITRTAEPANAALPLWMRISNAR